MTVMALLSFSNPRFFSSRAHARVYARADAFLGRVENRQKRLKPTFGGVGQAEAVAGAAAAQLESLLALRPRSAPPGDH
jgi:hypothetical protein